MDLNPKEKHADKKNEMQKERRSFLKKTVYAAPSLIVLGQLARPTKAEAQSCLECSPFDPNYPDCCAI